jgi:hypothetical protein
MIAVFPHYRSGENSREEKMKELLLQTPKGSNQYSIRVGRLELSNVTTIELPFERTSLITKASVDQVEREATVAKVDGCIRVLGVDRLPRPPQAVGGPYGMTPEQVNGYMLRGVLEKHGGGLVGEPNRYLCYIYSSVQHYFLLLKDGKWLSLTPWAAHTLDLYAYSEKKLREIAKSLGFSIITGITGSDTIRVVAVDRGDLAAAGKEVREVYFKDSFAPALKPLKTAMHGTAWLPKSAYNASKVRATAKALGLVVHEDGTEIRVQSPNEVNRDLHMLAAFKGALKPLPKPKKKKPKMYAGF